jgi:hypothetical protein
VSTERSSSCCVFPATRSKKNTNRQTDKQTDRQTDRHTHRNTQTYMHTPKLIANQFSRWQAKKCIAANEPKETGRRRGLGCRQRYRRTSSSTRRTTARVISGQGSPDSRAERNCGAVSLPCSVLESRRPVRRPTKGPPDTSASLNAALTAGALADSGRPEFRSDVVIWDAASASRQLERRGKSRIRMWLLCD